MKRKQDKGPQFGERLRAYREILGFSQVQLALALDVSLRSVLYWERSTFQPAAQKAIIQVLDRMVARKDGIERAKLRAAIKTASQTASPIAKEWNPPAKMAPKTVDDLNFGI